MCGGARPRSTPWPPSRPLSARTRMADEGEPWSGGRGLYRRDSDPSRAVRRVSSATGSAKKRNGGVGRTRTWCRFNIGCRDRERRACRRTRTILPTTTTIERLCADALVDAERQIEARIAERVPPRDLLLVGDRPQLVPNIRVDVDGDHGDHHAGRTVLVGLDRPPGAPPRGARQGLLKIRSGLKAPVNTGPTRSAECWLSDVGAAFSARRRD